MKTILMWALWVLGLAGVISGGGTPFAKSEQQAGIFAPYQDQARQLLDQMTPEQKIGQVFLVRCPEDSQLEQVQALHPGGLLLFGRDFKGKTAEQVRQKIQSYQQAAQTPLLIGADEEGGTVARVSACPQLREKRFSSPQKLYQQGGLESILADCREKDALLTSLGINVNLAPVADLSTDPGDFIYDRTLGQGTEDIVADPLHPYHSGDKNKHIFPLALF